MNLFDIIEMPEAYTPPEPPSLDGIRDLELDLETNGLKWWEKDRPIGIGIARPGLKTCYLPFGHIGTGGNLDEMTVRRWAQRELRGKRITNLNTRFDIHMLREWGVDLEAQGCEVSDVGHYAALLDDHRQRFSLQALVEDMLPDEKKVTHVFGRKLDATRMAHYHPSVVAERAEGDVRQVQKLKELMWPKLDEEDLQRVRSLEDEVIYVVCEMEKNGALIHEEKLAAWEKASEQELHAAIRSLRDMAGFPVNPNSANDMKRLFEKLRIPFTEFTATGQPSFTSAVLQMHIERPEIALCERIGKLTDLRSKYLAKYTNVRDSNGILRYALHQLRAERGEGGTAGTVSGRFSSTAVTPDVGINIQQVMKAAKQIKTYGDKYLIRELFIPPPGRLFLSADAKQIEYRMFASYANNPKIIAAYKENPDISFHVFMWELIKPYADLPYRKQKDLNFAKLYAAGIVKMAYMLEMITAQQFRELQAEQARRDHPLLAEARAVDDIYNREVPEVKPLLARASKLAETRGYVRTILGRRMRFPGGRRLHKALNGIIQGGAADINKRKLVELHKAIRAEEIDMTLRMTIHDEVDGDVPDENEAKKVQELLDHQSFPELKVPILWDVGTGENWKACGD
jgi:DNA polymerase-1